MANCAAVIVVIEPMAAGVAVTRQCYLCRQPMLYSFLRPQRWFTLSASLAPSAARAPDASPGRRRGMVLSLGMCTYALDEWGRARARRGIWDGGVVRGRA